jgi:hypothetical protein
VIQALLALYEDEDADIDDATLMNSLGHDPARERVVPCTQRARTAESPMALFECARRHLSEQALDREKRHCTAIISQIERSPSKDSPENVQLFEQMLQRLNEIHLSGRSPQAS